MITRVLNGTLKLFAWVAASTIMVLMFLIVSDILARNIFNSPIPGVLEISEISLAALVFLGIGWAQARRKHLSVSLLTDQLPKKLQIILEIVILLFCLCIFSMLTWQSRFGFSEAWRIGQYTLGLINVPIWPAKLAMLVGLAALCLQYIADIWSVLKKLFSPAGET